ncbi:MAG: adenine phosphoribosyltransferase [Bacteroidia bacterium]|nr:adenine phosphoribosyltransferase [Bacteroidia bacterium]
MPITTILKDVIREVPDFPIPGVLFKDISPVFLQPELIKRSAAALAAHWFDAGVTKVVGIDSRGFLFGPQIAAKLDAGFVMVRKKGKLPPETIEVSYALEYGEATLESVRESMVPGDRIIIHDDLLATGGTAEAAARLALSLGAEVVGFSFLINLTFLGGAARLSQVARDIHWLVDYEK